MQLEQSPFLSLVSEERIQQVLGLMGQPASAALTPAVALEVCQRAGGCCGAGRFDWEPVCALAAGKELPYGQCDRRGADAAARKEDVLSTLSRIASRFRGRAGEALASVDKLDTPLAEATTPSLEALRAYSMGFKVLTASGSAAAVPLYQRAIEIDPAVCDGVRNAGADLWGHCGVRAFGGEHNEGVETAEPGERPRTILYRRLVRHAGDGRPGEGAGQTCEAWAQTYPRDPNAHGFLGGAIYPVLGKYEQALDESRKMLELEPEFPVAYNLVALGYLPLGRLAESLATLNLAFERKIQMPDLVVGRYQVGFLRGDRAEMERAVALAAKTPGRGCGGEPGVVWSGVCRSSAAGASAVRGAVQMAQQAGQKERAAVFGAVRRCGRVSWE